MQDPWFLMNNKISSDNIYPVRITSYDMLSMPVLRNAYYIILPQLPILLEIKRLKSNNLTRALRDKSII